MPRAIWSGAISFGLVNVPVKLFTATSQKDVRFNQLHDKDGGRIQQRRVCSKCGEEVGLEDIVKGYEISRDRYVKIAPEELDALDPKATRTIDIEDFVDLDEIDPIVYESTYYTVPEKGASKAYRLLLDAMKSTNKVAIARVVLRNKQHLVALRPIDGAISLGTLLYEDEIVPTSSLEELPEEVEVSDRELKMAEQLIESLSSDFEHGKYRDEYRNQVLEMIERKAAGEEIAVAAPEEKVTPVVDLMAALEASLAAARGKKEEAPAEEEEAKPKRKRRTA
jgi:DNA end-binding protein Ku